MVRVQKGDLRTLYHAREGQPYGWGRAAYSEDRLHRYTLARTFLRQPTLIDASIRRVVFVMLNPSTATDMEQDPTIARCCGFAARWGYQELAVVNLYSWRETNPAAMFSGRGVLRAGDVVRIAGFMPRDRKGLDPAPWAPTHWFITSALALRAGENPHELATPTLGNPGAQWTWTTHRSRWTLTAAGAERLSNESAGHLPIAITDREPRGPDDITGGEANTMAIVETCSRADLVVAAWGADKRAVERGREVAALLRGMGHTLHCLGVSQAGHPRHPLYLEGDAKPELWAASTTVRGAS